MGAPWAPLVDAMKTMCPYPDCSGVLTAQGGCPSCGRLTKRCRACGEYSRAFALFCRVCGAPFPVCETDWTQFKGPRGRSGLSAFDAGRRLIELDHEHPLVADDALVLEGPCRSLLVHEGHVFAFWTGREKSGVTVARIEAEGLMPTAVFGLDAPINAEPVVHAGSLYLAAGHVLLAYTLAELAQGRPAPRWSLRLPAVPVTALLAVGDSLYLPLAYDRQRGDLVRFDGIAAAAPPRGVPLHQGPVPTSPVAHAGPDGTTAVSFLAAYPKGLFLGRTIHGDAQDAPRWQPVQGAGGPVDPFHPLACVDGKIYAVFSEAMTLCRIGIDQPMIEACIAPHTKGFALSRQGQAFVTTPMSVQLPHLALEERLSAGETISSPPLILGEFAALVGLGEGMVRAYDLTNLPRSRDWAVSRPSARVTILAPFGNRLLAGDSEGQVRMGRFVFDGAAGDGRSSSDTRSAS